MTSLYFDENDENCFIGNEDEGMSCPTCDAHCDPETYTMRMFIKNDTSPDDGLDYTTFIESIPKVSNITQYNLIHSYEYELKDESYGMTISTYGTVNILILNNDVYVMKVSFNDNGNCLELYTKSLEYISTHLNKVINHYGYEIGNKWTHCVDKETIEEAINEAIEKQKE